MAVVGGFRAGRYQVVGKYRSGRRATGHRLRLQWAGRELATDPTGHDGRLERLEALARKHLAHFTALVVGFVVVGALTLR